jgi:hypothetical protein
MILTLACLEGSAPEALAEMGGPPNKPDMTIDAATRTTVLDSVSSKLDRCYVDPALAKKMVAALTTRRKRGEYDKITSASAFGDSLTSQLRAVSHDRHLGVRYSHETVPDSAGAASPAKVAEDEEFARQRNYGFEQVERLRGNVGYLRLRAFVFGEEAGRAANAAMQLLSHTDALIIDLRQNGGGNGEMVQLLSTYLMAAGDPVQLNDMYSRPSNFTRQFWALPWVPGPRYTGKDVYLLTSKFTFSAAEEFCYDLKNLKRVTIVGETTGGGAHPVQFDRLTEHFMMSVPYAEAVNPVTKTNWEGAGVKPDVQVPSQDALKTAHILALKKIQATAKYPDELAETIQDIEKTGDSRVSTATPR